MARRANALRIARPSGRRREKAFVTSCAHRAKMTSPCSPQRAASSLFRRTLRRGQRARKSPPSAQFPLRMPLSGRLRCGWPMESDLCSVIAQRVIANRRSGCPELPETGGLRVRREATRTSLRIERPGSTVVEHRAIMPSARKSATMRTSTALACSLRRGEKDETLACTHRRRANGVRCRARRRARNVVVLRALALIARCTLVLLRAARFLEWFSRGRPCCCSLLRCFRHRAFSRE